MHIYITFFLHVEILNLVFCIGERSSYLIGNRLMNSFNSVIAMCAIHFTFGCRQMLRVVTKSILGQLDPVGASIRHLKKSLISSLVLLEVMWTLNDRFQNQIRSLSSLIWRGGDIFCSETKAGILRLLCTMTRLSKNRSHPYASFWIDYNLYLNVNSYKV